MWFILLILLPSIIAYLHLQANYEPWRREQEERVRRGRVAAAPSQPRLPVAPRSHRYNAYGEVVDVPIRRTHRYNAYGEIIDS